MRCKRGRVTYHCSHNNELSKGYHLVLLHFFEFATSKFRDFGTGTFRVIGYFNLTNIRKESEKMKVHSYERRTTIREEPLSGLKKIISKVALECPTAIS